MTTSTTTELLDHAVWSSLTGPHARFAERVGQAARYPADVSPFVAIAPGAGAAVWADLAHLIVPGETFALSGDPGFVATIPAGWTADWSAEGVQLIANNQLVTAPDAEAVVLSVADVADMLELVRRTEPGPFLSRTYELGTYLGIRREGALVAMAGERLHPSGWTEISAVCTDPAFRHQGLASRLVAAVAHGIRERGDRPLMHAAATNVNAIRLYESMGFTLRRRIGFFAIRRQRSERA